MLTYIIVIESIIIEIEEDEIKIATYEKEKNKYHPVRTIFSTFEYILFLTLSMDEIIFVLVRSNLKSDSSLVVRYT